MMASEGLNSNSQTGEKNNMLRKLNATKVTPIRDIIKVINTLVAGFRYRLIFSPHEAAPPDPVEGMVLWADGTSWNPGAGAGLYEYRSSAWNKL